MIDCLRLGPSKQGSTLKGKNLGLLHVHHSGDADQILHYSEALALTDGQGK